MYPSRKLSIFDGISILIMIVTAVVSLTVELRSPYWLDEAFTYALSCQDSAGSVLAMAAGDVHPPTYVLAIHGLFSWFGCDIGFARILSLAFAAIGIVVLARALHRARYDAITFLAILFSLPVFWRYATEARSYALLFCCTCIILALALYGGKWARMSMAVVAAAASSVHFFASYLFGVVLVLWWRFGRRFYQSHSLMAVLVGCLVVVAILYGVTLPKAVQATSGSFWIKAPDIYQLVFGVPIYIFWSPGEWCAYALLVLYIIYRIISYQEQDLAACLINCEWALVTTGLFALFPLLLYVGSQIKPIFVYRYLVFLLPLVPIALLFAAHSVYRERPVGALSAVIALRLVGLGFCVVNTISLWAHSDRIRALNWVEASATARCYAAEPCLFVLDDPVLPAFTDAQYRAVANVFNQDKSRFVVVRPSDLANRPDLDRYRQLIYVESFSPVIEFEHFRESMKMTCHDGRIAGIGALLCSRADARS
jgi:hypothetical protein